MKTKYSIRAISLYSVIGFIGLMLTSCSSYQNTSSYNDGIYNSKGYYPENSVTYKYNDGNVKEYRDGEVTGQNMNYKEYFNSLQDEYPGTAFTDVDAYSSYDNPNDTVYYHRTRGNEYNTGYAGWGEESSNVNVNIYGGGWNNWYGPGWGLGWNSWYGGYGGGWGWGLGWNSWYGGYGGWGLGWGYPYYGWNNWHYPYYGNHYYNNRYYNGGRRGTIYNQGRNSYAGGRNPQYATGRYSNNAAASRNAVTTGRNPNARYTTSRNTGNTRFTNSRNTTTVRTRGNVPQFNNNSTRPARNTFNNNSNRNNTINRSNNNFNTPRNSAPVRSAPTISPSRSSGSSGGFGGGRSGGGGGGGSRSGGGGRR